MATPPPELPCPDMSISSTLHSLSLSPDASKAKEVSELLLKCHAVDFHAENAAKYELPKAPKAARAERDKALKKLTDKLESLEKDSGDSDVQDAVLAVADFHLRALEFEAADERLDQVLAMKKVSASAKVNALLSKIRSRLWRRVPATDLLAECEALLQTGGDWDKRNRVKVYKSLSLALTRDYADAAPLLLSCVKTFSCEECVGYEHFVKLTVVLNMLGLTRPEIKKDLVDSPEIISDISPDVGG
ncbi:hypothetical protein TeGR_g2300, partial [Tetraparma gracilis]